MPVFDLQDGKDLEAAIERMLNATTDVDALARLRAVFVESLDFEPANGVAPLDDAELPAQATRIAQRENVQVVAVILQEATVRADRSRAVLKAMRRTLGDDVLLIAADAGRDEWQLIYPATTAGREVLRRMVVRRDEGRRTVVEQLVGMYQVARSGKDFRRALEAAYDVEAVTRTFFRTYRAIFYETVMPALMKSFPDEERRTLYAQKLFNRLLFIRFLEKKGWLTFDGRTDYLRALWEDHTAKGDAGDNFYRDRLCLLFFEGLNQPVQADRLAWRIGTVPYLNGGLFEQGEDDRGEVDVPDSIFAPIMDGLLYHFNFTVTEATPLEVEVAVDPEMLGKVFEELVTGRHESGSYYTPKPIVAFMGREALKGYLATAVPGESADALARFVDAHDPSDIRNGMAVLEALRAVRICDPACGSGAYLLGMLHELLDLRQCLFATRKLGTDDLYQEKLEIIQRNLYGVDLKPFAVNIARLRLWLSLAVEYDGPDPPPLPNLDYRIEAGDSLLAPMPTDSGQLGLVWDQIREYQRKTGAFMRSYGEQKRVLEAEIDALRPIIDANIHMGRAINGFKWYVEFGEAFEHGGFDIVLANPPYVRQELISALKPALKTVYPAVYAGTADLYCYFYARALQLLKPGGMLAFISSNKWFRAAYGKNLRAHIAATCAVRSITDFGDLPVFESASAYPMIFIAEKQNTRATPPIWMREEIPSSRGPGHSMIRTPMCAPSFSSKANSFQPMR